MVGMSKSVQDLQTKMEGGLSPLFYGHIPYIPVYAAAGDEVQFGTVQANGTVRSLHLLLLHST